MLISPCVLDYDYQVHRPNLAKMVSDEFAYFDGWQIFQPGKPDQGARSMGAFGPVQHAEGVDVGNPFRAERSTCGMSCSGGIVAKKSERSEG